MKKYLYLMRVHHYIKNILIFMPLIFSGNLTDRRKFTATLLGMIAFSLVTSAVYIINDIRDAEKDRMHPTKKNRPNRIRRSHTVSRSSADGVHSDRSSGTACGVRCDSGQLCAGNFISVYQCGI